jgi:hypothetical protein
LGKKATLNSQRLRCWAIASLVSIVFWLAYPAPAQGCVCDQRNGQQICVERIQRSAKKYWEYRVQLTVNGVAQPLVFYNCYQQKKSQDRGAWVDLVEDKIDRLACSLFHGI